MKVIYEAFDGTQFEEKNECLEYELIYEEERISEQIILLDQYGGVIADRVSEVDFDRVFTIVVGNEEAVEFLNKLFNENDTHVPRGGFQTNTVYWWDDEKIEWTDVAEKIAELNEEVDFFEKKLFLLRQI